MACDRGLVAAGLRGGNIEIRDIFPHWRKIAKAHENIVRALIFIPSDGSLVSGSLDGLVKRWDEGTGAEVWSRDLGIGFVLCVCALPDGRLAVGGDDPSVRVLAGATGDLIIGPYHLGALPVLSRRWRGDKTIRVWASDGTPSNVVQAGAEIVSFAASPCGTFVASGQGGGVVVLYRLPNWDQVWSVTAHEKSGWSVSWSPDGRFLANDNFEIH
jgi:WD40 repeat protein